MAAPSVDLRAPPVVRSLENPLIAIFDLADQINERVPIIRRTLRIAMGLTSIVFLLVGILTLVFLAQGNPIAALLFLVALLVLGNLLVAMYRTNSFFDYFEARHRTIKIVRDADPIVYIPKGRDDVDRLLQLLKQQSPRFGQLGAQFPHYIHTPAILPGRSGVSYHFDAYAFIPCSATWEMFGRGDRGWALFVKAFDTAPTLRDLQALEIAIADVTARSQIQPSRVIALVRQGSDSVIPEDAYQRLISGGFVVPLGRHRLPYAIQAISIDADGTYDFVPVIGTTPDQLP